jgi:hypothetical protein
MHKRILSAIAVTCLALAGAACKGGDETPVQEATVLTLTSGEKTIAFGYSANRGYHFAQVADGALVKYAGATTQFLSGSLSGSTSFSGTIAGSSSFSGGTSFSTTFGGGVPLSTTFTAGGIGGGSCNLASLCTFADQLCEGFVGLGGGDADEACASFDVGQCYAAVSNPDVLFALNDELANDPQFAALFCVIVDLISCIVEAGPAFDEAVAEQCLDSSGLFNAIAAGDF